MEEHVEANKMNGKEIWICTAIYIIVLLSSFWLGYNGRECPQYDCTIIRPEQPHNCVYI